MRLLLSAPSRPSSLWETGLYSRREREAALSSLPPPWLSLPDSCANSNSTSRRFFFAAPPLSLPLPIFFSLPLIATPGVTLELGLVFVAEDRGEFQTNTDRWELKKRVN